MWWKSIAEEIVQILRKNFEFSRFMSEKWGDENAEWKYLFLSDIEKKYVHMWDLLYFSGIEPAWTCKDCRSFWEDSEYGDYGVEYSYERGCYKNPSYDFLKTFPFWNAPQRCFCPDFWKIHFASMLDGTDLGEKTAFSRYEDFVNRRYPVQAGDAEQLEEDLAAKATGVTLDPEADY